MPRPTRRRLGWLAGALVALAVLALLALPWLVRRDAVRERLEAALSGATGYDVTIGTLGVAWPGVVTLDALAVAATPGEAPFLAVRRVRVLPSLATVVHGRARRIDLYDPTVALHALPRPTAAAGEPDMALPAEEVVVDGGRLRTGPDDDALVLGPFEMTVDRVSAARGLELGGRHRSADGALAVRWFARLGTDLRRVAAKVRVRMAAVPALGSGGRGALVVRGDPQGTLAARARLAAGAGPALAAHATLDVPARAGRVETRLPEEGIALGDWRLAGGLAAPFRLEPGAVVAEPSATVAFRDAAGLRIGERVQVGGTLRLPRASPATALAVDLRAGKGEVLWDRLFLDLAERPVTTRGTVGYDQGEVVLDELALSLADAGTATLDGRWNLAGGDARLGVALDVPRLGTLFDVAVREPFGDVYPLLGGTTVSGRLGGTLRLAGAERPTLSGRLRLADVSAVSTDPRLAVESLSAELPVSLGPDAPLPSDPSGRLALAGLVLGDVRIGPIDAGLAAAPNALRLTEAVRVPVLGGHVEVVDFAAQALDQPARSARFGLAVRGVEMPDLSAALGWPALRGTVAAAIPTVVVEAGAVRTEGEVDVRVFDGRVQVRNLRVDELGSPVPAVGLDLDFAGVSLGAMTEALAIGTITGVVRGWVRDLVVVNGQPVRFEAALESVERRGVPQEISVRAIRQISIVAGPGGDALSGGILGLFDRYRYAKLGLRCELQNDRFRLRGIDEHDGKQVLVAGSLLPPRVNVYSQSRVIGFSEMMRRLQRALETGADEGGSE